ncbi:MAG: dihydroorotase [Candidatus Omnitrophota bacterium]|nr:dihydroorotase [Candidatus Omnitrophota bacterium]
MRLLIKNGRVVDPANNIDAALDILVADGKIVKVAKDIKANGAQIIDAADKIIIPGLVDMHVHLREPGREDKETVESGTAAALKGGVTTLLAMPNTTPAIDSEENIALLKKIIGKSAQANVLICGAISKGRLGKELSGIAELKKAGALAISDDGSSVDNDDLLLDAFKQAKEAGLLVICHSEDKALSGKGVVNRGLIATRMGLRGISHESEYLRVERDIKLAKKTGVKIHIAHVSCKESVILIAAAKKQGVKVTAEAAPHHFSFTEEAVLGFDTNFKMNPPLRSKADREALRQALKDGTIDCIASDHAPHTENEKDIEFDRAEFGVIGLETELSAAITELVETKLLDWPRLVEKMAVNPARILGIDQGSLATGKDADIVIIDPKQERLVEKQKLISRSKNCAFLGMKLRGVVEYTIYKGEVHPWNS